MHLKLSILFLIIIQSSTAFCQKNSCLDTNARLQEIRNLYNNTQKAKKSFNVFELFLSVEENGRYHIVPLDTAVYLGEDATDIIYYAGPVFFRYKNDSLKALDDKRVFIFTDMTGQVRLITTRSHDDPEGASLYTREFYLHNNQLYFSFTSDINTDYWSGAFTESIKENRYYYCNSGAISCLEKKSKHPLGADIDLSKIENESVNLSEAKVNFSEFQQLLNMINEAKSY